MKYESVRRWFGRWTALGWLLCTGAGILRAADAPRLADYFGFLPLEVYKLEPRIGNLVIKVFYGNPAEVVVLFNEGGGEFGQSQRINTGEAIESGSALTVGDLNRDGRDDLALLESNEVVVVFQGPSGRLGEPERLPHTADNP